MSRVDCLSSLTPKFFKISVFPTPWAALLSCQNDFFSISSHCFSFNNFFNWCYITVTGPFENNWSFKILYFFQTQIMVITFAANFGSWISLTEGKPRTASSGPIAWFLDHNVFFSSNSLKKLLDYWKCYKINLVVCTQYCFWLVFKEFDIHLTDNFCIHNCSWIVNPRNSLDISSVSVAFNHIILKYWFSSNHQR